MQCETPYNCKYSNGKLKHGSNSSPPTNAQQTGTPSAFRTPYRWLYDNVTVARQQATKKVVRICVLLYSVVVCGMPAPARGAGEKVGDGKTRPLGGLQVAWAVARPQHPATDCHGDEAIANSIPVSYIQIS